MTGLFLYLLIGVKINQYTRGFNMPIQQMSFIRGDKVSSEVDYRDALPVNMTAVLRETFGFNGYMQQVSGLRLHATGEGIDRGGIWDARRNAHYRVSGERLIQVLADGTTENLGAITGADTAEFAYSFNNLAIVANGQLYLYNATAGLRRVTDPDVGAPIDICWIDNYLFMTDGENIFHTEITDENQVDPLDFATSEFDPDFTYGVERTSDNRVMVFNRYTCEFYQNTGADNFAFARLNGYVIEAGIVGTHAKTQVDSNYYGVGNGKNEAVSFYAFTKGGQQKLATREIEKILGSYPETALRDVIVESRTEDGYQHVLVHLPNETLLLNLTIAQGAGLSNAWSIIKSGVQTDRPWRGVHGVFDNNLGHWVYGDKEGANIGIYDETIATQYGDIAEWLLFTQFYPVETASINSIDIQTIPGFATTEDTTLFISLTDDGFVYKNEKTLQYGKRHQYRHRLIARRLGYVNEFVGFRLRGASRAKMLIGAGVFDYG